MKLGPVGDHRNGKNWEEVCSDRISHIFVSFDERALTSIQFGYAKTGAPVLSKKHGSSSNSHSTRIVNSLTNYVVLIFINLLSILLTKKKKMQVRLNHVSEFITGISGQCFCGDIISLTFHTNQKAHEAFRSTSNTSMTTGREFHSGMLDRRELVVSLDLVALLASTRLVSI